MNKELQRLLQQQRKEESYHTSMETEFNFYRKIANGDLNFSEVNEINSSTGKGKLSDNPIRNERYHGVILVAMITRFCIEAGLDSEEAYTLSDMYIRRIDETSDIKLIQAIQREMVSEFGRTMKELHSNNINNLQVKRGIDYVTKNLTKPITSKDVGEYIGCNSDYLSRLFKKELGLTLGDYILKRKCMTACYMLENSNETITDIAVFLGFSSTSHFIDRFKMCMGESPSKYRKEVGLGK